MQRRDPLQEEALCRLVRHPGLDPRVAPASLLANLLTTGKMPVHCPAFAGLIRSRVGRASCPSTGGTPVPPTAGEYATGAEAGPTVPQDPGLWRNWYKLFRCCTTDTMTHRSATAKNTGTAGPFIPPKAASESHAKDRREIGLEAHKGGVAIEEPESDGYQIQTTATRGAT